MRWYTAQTAPKYSQQRLYNSIRVSRSIYFNAVTFGGHIYAFHVMEEEEEEALRGGSSGESSGSFAELGSCRASAASILPI